MRYNIQRTTPLEQVVKVATVSSSKQKVQIAPDLAIGAGEPVVLMAGPCSVESYEQVRAVAAAMAVHGLRVCGFCERWPTNLACSSSPRRLA